MDRLLGFSGLLDRYGLEDSMGMVETVSAIPIESSTLSLIRTKTTEAKVT